MGPDAKCTWHSAFLWLDWRPILFLVVMKLGDFNQALIRAVKQYVDEGDICDLILEGKNKPPKIPGEILKITNDVRAEIYASFKANKGLLGIYKEPNSEIQPPLSPEEQEEIKKREIRPENIKRFLLKVRHDLRKHKPKYPESENSETFGWIMVRMLTDATKAVSGSRDLGPVFGETELEMYREEFERKSPVHYEPTFTRSTFGQLTLPEPVPYGPGPLPEPPKPNAQTLKPLPMKIKRTTPIPKPPLVPAGFSRFVGKPVPPSPASEVPDDDPDRIPEDVTPRPVILPSKPGSKPWKPKPESQDRPRIAGGGNKFSPRMPYEENPEVEAKIKALEAQLRAEGKLK